MEIDLWAIDPDVMVLGFTMGLSIGLTVNLINKTISALFRWFMSW